MFYIGEGETQYDALFDLYKKNKQNGGSRMDFLEAAAKLPGIYVPMFYDVAYNEDGTIASFTPNKEGIPATITKELAVYYGPGYNYARSEYEAVPANTSVKAFFTENGWLMFDYTLSNGSLHRGWAPPEYWR